MLRQQNGLLEDLCAEIGYTATMTLVDFFGGASLYVPGEAAEKHKLAKLIGFPAYRKLVAAYGATTLNMPLDFQRERNQRNRLIGALTLRGMNSKDIGALCGISPRNVDYVKTELQNAGILADLKDSEDLFGYQPAEIANIDEFEILHVASIDEFTSINEVWLRFIKNGGSDTV